MYKEKKEGLIIFGQNFGNYGYSDTGKGKYYFSTKLTGTNWGLSSTPFSSVGTVKHILSKESVVGSAFIFDNISTEGFDQNSPGVFNLWQVSNLTSAHS